MMSLRAVGEWIALLLGALLLSALVVLVAGRDPGQALVALFDGAFGSRYGFLNVWTKACPLLLAGLAVTVAFRAGFWNIGAEGQIIVGAIVAGWLGTWPGIAAGLHPVLILTGAFLAGAVWCMIAAWLKVRRGAFEVISTILLNFIALYLLSWLVQGPLREASGAQPVGDPLVSGALLPRLFGRMYTLHAGILLALAAMAAVHVFLSRTETGFHIRAVGGGPRAAAWAGIPVDRTLLLTAAVSGGLAGLAGAVEVMGVLGRLFDKVSPGYGFTAIAVALLARLNPLALLPAALFFGALEAGASRLQQEADVSYVIVLVIQAVVILASVVIGRRRGGA
ncbi:MAG: ABC transporter permease [Gemmatimonadetes bacterium]|nr:ABC transporter permease [Gemmatimonadota bacterium]